MLKMIICMFHRGAVGFEAGVWGLGGGMEAEGLL